jgi:hypothetical protein
MPASVADRDWTLAKHLDAGIRVQDLEGHGPRQSTCARPAVWCIEEQECGTASHSFDGLNTSEFVIA